jgi:L-malate glycosyltransferase
VFGVGKVVRALFSWEFIGPHHLARVHSCQNRDEKIGIRVFALADRSRTYDFYHDEEVRPEVTVAYRSATVEDLSLWKRLCAYVRYVWVADEDVYFLCHYERFEVFLTAVVLRLRRKKVFVMNDSKFDDYQRNIFREVGKSIFYTPYCGALVSGARSASYLRFLGVGGQIETGYDTIDSEQMREKSRRPSEGLNPKTFFITVSRLVARKNIGMIIRAFAAFCQESEPSIQLIIVGEGPEKQTLLDLADCLHVGHRVKFLGLVPNEGIPSLVANSIALLLMSSSEQWGLVVNEAVACGVPVIVSEAVGARDTLVRNFVNGYVIEDDNLLGLTRAMLAVLRDANGLVPPGHIARSANVECFADAVTSLLAAQQAG